MVNQKQCRFERSCLLDACFVLASEFYASKKRRDIHARKHRSRVLPGGGTGPLVGDANEYVDDGEGDISTNLKLQTMNMKSLCSVCGLIAKPAKPSKVRGVHPKPNNGSERHDVCFVVARCGAISKCGASSQSELSCDLLVRNTAEESKGNGSGLQLAKRSWC